ncbi:hypothetical protein [Nocardia terpenica]|uniref:Uncharacterized protein n=1 Tax=Nocardia terpenica TaxID=455432 RepID=A0A164LBY3_9NOCA|nr:hypothetical protein [Nocardia terpenica]KZM72239.1 hypothetical protein AWN90_36810 [Nocardia terpenica]NQE86615.1 hypothetical protein [Nocardia terpenica]
MPVVGDVYRDKREDNFRTLRVVKDLGDGRFECLVIEQTYRGITKYPNRTTTPSVKHLTTMFVLISEGKEATV